MKLGRLDTLFGRFLLVVLVGILISHLLTTWMFMQFSPQPDKPPQPKPGWSVGDARPPAPPPRVQEPPPPRPQGAGRLGVALPPGLGWVLLIQCLVLSGGAWLAARGLIRPIQAMAQAARHLGLNLHAPAVSETGPYEVRQVARVFNQMQQQLVEQIEQRARFLAAVSHDLRTPLTRLQLRLERLPDPILRGAMRTDINDMTAMLNATLEYLREESQHQTDPWQYLDSEALVDAMVENGREVGQNLRYHGNAAPIRVQPMALKRCLMNLIDNALHYAGEADIGLQDSAEALCIEVRDSGPGIQPDTLEQVFEPFFRLDPSRNPELGGVGLGLSIARDIALRHGGTLSLHNADQGGLIARLRLPREPLGAIA